MSKLSKLKQWVTIPDAARYLSQILDEPVSEADVIQIALDGHFKLSVVFPNGAMAKIGRIVAFKDLPIRQLPSLDDGRMLSFPDGYMLNDLQEGESIDSESLFIHFDEKVVSIEGLWDLAMRGGERFTLEKELHRLIGGPEVGTISLEGTFLNRPDGSWASLHDKLPDEIIFDEDGGKKKKRGSYYSAGGLVDDYKFVMRTSEILEFQLRLHAPSVDKPLSNKERDTLLTIIGVLCNDAGYDYLKHAKTANLLQDAAAKMGVRIGETTIENHLKKISDALASRMK